MHLGLDLYVVLIPVAAQFQVKLAAGGEQLAVHIAQLACAERKHRRIDAALFLRAFTELHAHAAVFAFDKCALAVQTEVDRRRLFVFDHQHLYLKFLSAAYIGRHGQHERQLVRGIQHGHILAPGGLQQALVFGRLGGQVHAAALARHIELPALACICAHRIDRLDIGLVIGHTEVAGALSEQLFLSLDHLQLAQHGFLKHDHASLVIQRHAAFDQQGRIVARRNAKAAHHARAEAQPVEQLGLAAVIVLLDFKIAHSQQLSVKIPVPLHGKKISIAHVVAPPIVVS